MSPPISTISLSALETEVNLLPSGKLRKPKVKLSDCPLKELVQYKCNISVAERQGEKNRITCEPVVRLFRQCENGLNIETTAWENWKGKQLGDREIGIVVVQIGYE